MSDTKACGCPDEDAAATRPAATQPLALFDQVVESAWEHWLGRYDKLNNVPAFWGIFDEQPMKSTATRLQRLATGGPLSYATLTLVGFASLLGFNAVGLDAEPLFLAAGSVTGPAFGVVQWYRFNRADTKLLKTTEFGRELYLAFREAVTQLQTAGRTDSHCAATATAVAAQLPDLELALEDLATHGLITDDDRFDLTPSATEERHRAYRTAAEAALTIVTEAQASAQLALEAQRLRDEVAELTAREERHQPPATRRVVREQADGFESDIAALVEVRDRLGGTA